MVIEWVLNLSAGSATTFRRVLSLAGVGFDRTRLKVVADPALRFNTHSITIKGKTGTISLRFESVPSPDNPKTAMLACYRDRKSTRLNSSHLGISYAVFCLKKKNR